jgi:hypothetical protein
MIKGTSKSNKKKDSWNMVNNIYLCIFEITICEWR